MKNVSISFQNNGDSRPIVEAILADNAGAKLTEFPAMVKIDRPGSLVINKASVEERLGRDFDLQEIHLNVISLSGNIDETDEHFELAWRS